MAERNIILNDEATPLDNLADGRQVIKTTPDGARIFVDVTNGEITQYSAQDSAGGSLQVSYLRMQETGGIKCWVCIDTPGGQFCYGIDCNKLPKPSVLDAEI